LAEKAVEKGDLRLADAKHDLRKWGFAKTPSEKARAEKNIARLERSTENLRANLERLNERRRVK
jgi:hypothetical protein